MGNEGITGAHPALTAFSALCWLLSHVLAEGEKSFGSTRQWEVFDHQSSVSSEHVLLLPNKQVGEKPHHEIFKYLLGSEQAGLSPQFSAPLRSSPSKASPSRGDDDGHGHDPSLSE